MHFIIMARCVIFVIIHRTIKKYLDIGAAFIYAYLSQLILACIASFTQTPQHLFCKQIIYVFDCYGMVFNIDNSGQSYIKFLQILALHLHLYSKLMLTYFVGSCLFFRGLVSLHTRRYPRGGVLTEGRRRWGHRVESYQDDDMQVTQLRITQYDGWAYGCLSRIIWATSARLQ